MHDGSLTQAQLWVALELRVSREMEGVPACRERGLWCDGFLPSAFDLDDHPPCVRGRVWIGRGDGGQEAWDFELLLPRPVSSVDEIPWADLLPGEHVTRWLSVDDVAKRLVVAPGEAVDNPGSADREQRVDGRSRPEAGPSRGPQA